jgi:hypothetical protein
VSHWKGGRANGSTHGQADLWVRDVGLWADLGVCERVCVCVPVSSFLGTQGLFLSRVLARVGLGHPCTANIFEWWCTEDHVIAKNFVCDSSKLLIDCMPGNEVTHWVWFGLCRHQIGFCSSVGCFSSLIFLGRWYSHPGGMRQALCDER